MTSILSYEAGDDGIAPSRRLPAIAVVMIGTTMAVLDASITTVALPAIAQDLRVAPAAAVWVANAYQLVSAVCIIALAALGDRVGYRRVYGCGLLVFTLGSAGCALATSLPPLVAARMVQGLGAAAMMSVGPALYRAIFPARLLGTALGLSALTVAASSAAGPMLGGLILGIADWPWLFAINLPLGLPAILLAWRNLPADAGRGGGFDYPGALLAALAMGSFVIAVDAFSRQAGAVTIGGLLLLCLAAAVAFLHCQNRSASPLLPLELFAASRFSLAALTSTCSFISQGLTFVTLPFLFQGDYGYTPLLSGLLFTPWPLTIMVAAPLAGRLADRHGPRLLATLGLAILVLGLGALALLGKQVGPVDIIWRAALCGIGFGFFQSPNNRELLGMVPLSLSGAASGVLASARTFGQSVGAALAAIVLAVPLDPAAGPLAAVPLGRIHLALWLAGGMAAAACAVSAWRTRG